MSRRNTYGQWIGTLVSWICLICCFLAVSGCSNKAATSTNISSAETSAYQVTDTQGTVLTLPHKPQRIVTLSLSTDEILLDMVPQEKVAAVYYLADDPGISTIADKVSHIPARMKDVHAEMIVGLQPDLVIAPDWNQPELIQTLKDFGIPVFVCKGPSSVLEVKQAISEVARAIGEEEKGRQMISKMETDLAAIADKVAKIPLEKRQTVVLISHMAAYGGKGSLFDDMCNYAGVINGAAAIGLGKNDTLSKEGIVKADPDLIIVPAWSTAGLKDTEVIKADLQNDPALQTVKAIRNKRLIQVSDMYLYCASHDIVEGIRNIMDAAYTN
jgi:iron complex transport system substrate-binding protein